MNEKLCESIYVHNSDREQCTRSVKKASYDTSSISKSPSQYLRLWFEFLSTLGTVNRKMAGLKPTESLHGLHSNDEIEWKMYFFLRM